MGMCNETVLREFGQMDSHLYHSIFLVSSSLSYGLNMLLSVPLLLAITRSPSLLGKLRFLLLVNLLCCDNLQLLIQTTKAALFMSRLGMRVKLCLVFGGALQGCSMVQVLLSAALAVDRCVAIKWPLRYELLLGPSRRRVVVGVAWASSILACVSGVGMALSSVQYNAVVPRCRPLVVAHCLVRNSRLRVFCMALSALILPTCYLITLACFLLLCWDVRGLPRSRRAVVTLALQAIQMLCYSVPVILGSYLLPSSLQCDTLDIAISNAYNLGISLIPLVYGYRSRELQKRLLQASPRNNINPAE